MKNKFFTQTKAIAMIALMTASTSAFAGDVKAKAEIISPAAGTEINNGKDFTLKVKVTNNSPYMWMASHMGMPGDYVSVKITVDGQVATTVKFDLTADLMAGSSVTLEKKVYITVPSDKKGAQFCTSVSVSGTANPDAGASPCGSVELKVHPTAISAIGQDIAVDVYPNPAASNLNVVLPAGVKGSIAVFDLTGKQIISESLTDATNSVSVANIPAGTYLYRIADTDGKLVQAGKVAVSH